MVSRTRTSESGFTLAGLIIILTVMAVFIAYTIPRQWSIAVARDRDQQTLFAMKQYARAIKNFQEAKNNPAKAVPTSLDQLKQARNPRVIRGKGEFVDPLTGEVDWIVVPVTAQNARQGAVPGVPGVTPPVGGVVAPQIPQPGMPGAVPQKPGQPGGFVGPMAGVRPNKTGTSYLVVNGSDNYEQWSYTTQDLQAEILQHINAMMIK